MAHENDPLEDLIVLLSRLPGIGKKTATRLAFHLITTPTEYVTSLASALNRVAEQIHPCEICGNFTAEATCRICRDPRRDSVTVCVVSRVQDLLAIEAAGGFRGLYHVLHGLLSPLDGIGPEDIAIGPLLRRIEQSETPAREVILAISPSVEGETTSLYLAKALSDLDVRVTRIAAGVPMGGELEYTDHITLGRALADRREV